MKETRDERHAAIPAVAFSLFLGFATIASGQSTAKATQSAAGHVTTGKLISMGTTSLQSPMTGKTMTPASAFDPDPDYQRAGTDEADVQD